MFLVQMSGGPTGPRIDESIVFRVVTVERKVFFLRPLTPQE